MPCATAAVALLSTAVPMATVLPLALARRPLTGAAVPSASLEAVRRMRRVFRPKSARARSAVTSAPAQTMRSAGGTVFVQSTLQDPAALWASIPEPARVEILARGIRVAALDTATLARRWAPRPDLVVRMQGIALVGAFLRLTPFAARAGMDRAALLAALRPVLQRFFGKRGTAVVDANEALVTEAYDSVIDVTAAVIAVVPAPASGLAGVGVW